MCTAAPNGRMKTAATRSLEIAADGFTLNNRISIGVISAPPPAPVSPTSRPTTALPSTIPIFLQYNFKNFLYRTTLPHCSGNRSSGRQASVDKLQPYRDKRDPARTPEPVPDEPPRAAAPAADDPAA